MITWTKLFEQFNKLLDCYIIDMDEGIKRVHKLALKIDKVNKFRWEKRWKRYKRKTKSTSRTFIIFYELFNFYF
jgi:hypothetical protein